MDTSISITYILRRLFYLFQKYSSHVFPYKLLFNCSEKKTCSNISDTIRKGARPDTLVIASGCTLLVGEDKLFSLHATENDLLKKMLPYTVLWKGAIYFGVHSSRHSISVGLHWQGWQAAEASCSTSWPVSCFRLLQVCSKHWLCLSVIEDNGRLTPRCPRPLCNVFHWCCRRQGIMFLGWQSV